MRISNITRPVWSIALTAAVAVVLAAALATPADTTTTDALNRCNAGFPSDSSMSFPKDGQDSRWTPVETSTLRSGNVVRIALHRVYFGGRAPTRVHVCIHQVSELVAGCGCVGTGSPQPMTIRPCPTGFQSHRGQCPTPAVANLTMPAGPAVAAAAPAVAAAPGVAVDHSQTWPGRSMLVTLSGFDDCAAAGASGYLRWDDTTVAGPFSMQNQPVQFTIEIPNNAASGSHLLSATCPGELITHGYGASTSIEVVPRPRSKFVVLPGSFSPGSRVDVEGAELPAECANGRFTVRLGERDLPVDISARSLEPYGSTGMDVTAFQGTFVAPADLQSGRRTATLICPDVGKVKATAVTVRTAPIRPAPSGRTPPDPDMSTPEQTSADLGWEPAGQRRLVHRSSRRRRDDSPVRRPGIAALSAQQEQASQTPAGCDRLSADGRADHYADGEAGAAGFAAEGAPGSGPRSSPRSGQRRASRRHC